MSQHPNLDDRHRSSVPGSRHRRSAPSCDCCRRRRGWSGRMLVSGSWSSEESDRRTSRVDRRSDIPGGVRDRQSPGCDRRSGWVCPCRRATGWRRSRRRSTARSRGRAISVENHDRDESWSFRNHVEPILTKQGCNSGACHGAAAGKNGFRLTLRGYAPEIDHAVLTRQALGRRIVKTAPAGEPAAAQADRRDRAWRWGPVRDRLARIPGDRRMDRRRDAGALRRRPGDPLAPDLHPAAVRMEPGQGQQVLVQAAYSDGRVEDVTHWAKFSSTDEGVVTVDDAGRFKVSGRGEAYVSVWFASRVGRVTVTVPFDTKLDPDVFAKAASQEPDRREEPRQAGRPADSTVAGCRRRRVPPSGLPRRDRHLASRRARSKPSSTIATRTNAPSWSTGCSRARSSSITGRTSGRTFCWSRRGSCRPRRCGRSTSSCGRAWRRTCPGTGSPARS